MKILFSNGLKIGAMLLCLTLSGCGFSSGDPSPSSSASQRPATEFSMFDDAGITEIENSLSVRIDFRDGAIAKSAVGLPDTSYAPDLVAPDGQMFQLRIDGPLGTLNAQTDHVRFTTTDSMPTIDIIYYFLTATDNESLFELLRAGVQDYGIDSEAVETKIAEIIAEPEDTDNYALAVGSSLGFNVGYDLRYDGSNDKQVIIVTVSEVS